MKTVDTNTIQEISDTAFWVCSYRAEESKRKNSLFTDPFAERLAGDKGKSIADNVSDSKYAGWTVVIRTKVIDEIIKTLVQSGVEMVINLGAGLDTRPYRMDLPQSLHWVEVDHPHLIHFKGKKMEADTPKCHLERVGVDLSDQESRKVLFEKLNSRNLKSLVLTEGVIPYLIEDQVSSLARDLKKNSNFLYWITEYHSNEMYKHLRSDRKNKEMGQSPFQFFPIHWLDFFSHNGWEQKDCFYLGEEGKKLGRPFPLPWWAKILHALLPKKELDKVQKMSGFMVLQKNKLTKG